MHLRVDERPEGRVLPRVQLALQVRVPHLFGAAKEGGARHGAALRELRHRLVPRPYRRRAEFPEFKDMEDVYDADVRHYDD